MPNAKKTSASKASASKPSASKASASKASASKAKKQSKPKKPTKAVAAKTPVETTPPPVETTPPPVETAAPVEVPPVEEPTVSTSQPTELDTLFANYNKQLTELRALEASLVSDFKKLQKATARHLKELSKKNKKRKLTDSQKKARAPSGFAKPTKISDQLCEFLNVKVGSEMARTEVTKHLTTYIKDNNLQDQANKRKILPDTALRNLLNVTDSDEVTYFNLQKYMKVHFPLSKANLAAAAAAASV
jgi:chromatin remodeling complex protein RSC6